MILLNCFYYIIIYFDCSVFEFVISLVKCFFKEICLKCLEKMFKIEI